MDHILNIFNDDAFSTTSLTDAINTRTYKPGRIGKLGLFTPTSTDTTSVAVEQKGDTIIVVPPTARGGPGTTVGKKGRSLLQMSVPHFEINDHVMAEEIQNVTRFGKPQQLEILSAKLTERASIHVSSMAVTQEKSRLGAVQGVVVYQDGTQLDLYQTFGVTKLSQLNFNLATNIDGKLRKFTTGLKRVMDDELGSIPYDEIHVFCGDNFFDGLMENKEFRESHLGWTDAAILRDSYLGKKRDSSDIVKFGGIVFENYRGSSNLGVQVPTDECALFPTGVDNLFRTVYAPADYVDTVNTMGERLYNHQYVMPNKKGIHFDVQMNALEYCTRPRVLMSGKRA
ncbi:major capsid protein [Maritalea porphyrae]|uniref:major capsid protein n=1 Tax=Maritalea porphyrae TaxID=880732 RepID=UPI0022AE62EC|nr:major capsid protein [Maritalea porphyrae]MCZ4270723.1 major capsid protein [Maritalea porphyrae]